jgi:hypothetical protein
MLYLSGANLLCDTIVANILYHCVAGRLILDQNNNMEEVVKDREGG